MKNFKTFLAESSNNRTHAATIKRAVFAAVPEYKNAKWANGGSRVSTSHWKIFNDPKDTKHEGVVRLGVGLLSKDAEDSLNKAGGDLHDTHHKIIKELGKHFHNPKKSLITHGHGEHRYHQEMYFKHDGLKTNEEFVTEAKDHTDRVVHHKGHFWVDREDTESGKQISKPGQKIKFTHKGKKYSGTVSDEARGRDDDVYKVHLPGVNYKTKD